MDPALGAIARLRSRSIYHAINSVSHLDNIVDLKTQRDVCDEIQLWSDCFHNPHGSPMHPLNPACSVMTWSDASDFAWGGYTLSQSGLCVARGSFPASVRNMSSTLRELKAARWMIESFITVISSGQLIHRTDNQAAAIILINGSRHPHLHNEAVAIFQICHKHGIQLDAEWLPQEFNV